MIAVLVADAGEIGFLRPVPQPLTHRLFRGGLLALRQLRVQRQVGPQPAQRLVAQAAALLRDEARRILALAAAGKGGGAGGVVASACAR